MKEKKLVSNIVYSILMQTAGFVAPLIISPYISRVLSARLIGDYSYTLANSSYFVLIESLGLTLYGTIRIAAIRDNKKELSKLFWEIVWLKIILMTLCTIAYVIWINIFETQTLKTLYYIMIINVIAGGIDITWFLNGLEEFKIIAARTIIARIINILLIFIFVKSKNDLILYALIMQSATLFGYIFVLPTALKKIEWVRFKDLNLWKHIKPSFVYFIPGLINTIFASTDKTILGAVGKNSYEVGVYEQSNKICQLCMSAINAISNAILPRVAYLHANNENKNETKKILKNSVRIAMMASLPMTIGISAISFDFIPAFFGNGYDKSAILLKILCLNVLFVVISNFIAQQCLIAQGKQYEYNIAVSIGAIVNTILNLLFVSDFKSIGVAFASVISSLLILIIVLYFSRNMILFKEILQMSWKYILGVIIMFLAIFKIHISQSHWLTVGIQVFVGAVIYLFILIITKDDVIRKILQEMQNIRCIIKKLYEEYMSRIKGKNKNGL